MELGGLGGVDTIFALAGQGAVLDAVDWRAVFGE